MPEDKREHRGGESRGYDSSYLRGRMSQNLTERIPKGHKFEFPPSRKELLQAELKKQKIALKAKIHSSTKAIKKIKRPKLKKVRLLPKKYAVASSVVVIGVLIFLLYITNKQSSEPVSVLSDTTNTRPKGGELPREKPSFDILFPSGISEENFEIVKISPDGREPAYTLVDTANGSKIQITQQKLPANFTTAPEVELEKTAKNFQATNVIQLDDMKVFHGYSEGTRVQSLIFIKDKLLIFITSSKQLPDDFWAGYIKALQ